MIGDKPQSAQSPIPSVAPHEHHPPLTTSQDDMTGDNTESAQSPVRSAISHDGSAAYYFDVQAPEEESSCKAGSLGDQRYVGYNDAPPPYATLETSHFNTTNTDAHNRASVSVEHTSPYLNVSPLLCNTRDAVTTAASQSDDIEARTVEFFRARFLSELPVYPRYSFNPALNAQPPGGLTTPELFDARRKSQIAAKAKSRAEERARAEARRRRAVYNTQQAGYHPVATFEDGEPVLAPSGATSDYWDRFWDWFGRFIGNG
ncbi:hypothetical protein DACRYDRAFT_104208 [Dacryopinax primogenitus]|uniref:Uncharacterized protein n=1 Tax=Dacryopinax primogenitus (strain DJM 731) TaxID=1858805 RepID=M5GEV6_DACPD|nr:uncharacterized protein DACRYDRAFT_104208 [Dacryopinax primogenitus]EJU05722.1 hypothetical protein DACRYDRAFT_104208 [Dacryopinax primogenitus]